MRFKEYIKLNEATKKQNIIDYLSDKTIKIMKDMVLNKDRYKKFKSPIGYYISIKDIINKNHSDKDSLDLNIIKGITILFRKGKVESGNPFFEKDGKKLEGLASFSHGNIVSIPFIDETTNDFFQGFFDHYKSIIVHELTHIFQRINDISKLTDSSKDDYKTWLSKHQEQEAILNQVFSAFRSFIKNEIELMQRFRKEKIIRPYVMKNDKLQELFSSSDSFIKNITKEYDDIFKEYLTMKKSSIRNHYFELGVNYPKIEKEFLENSYNELKKEFKNVLPEKRMSYRSTK